MNKKPPAAKTPIRFWLTFLHLGALGVLGWVVLTVAMTLLGVGLGLVLLAGVGLVLLVGLIYVLYGVAALEVARVSGLYRLQAEPLRVQKPKKKTFGGWIRSLGSQLADGRMWAANGSFVVTTILGSVLLVAVQIVYESVALMVAGITAGDLQAGQQLYSFPFWTLNPLFALLVAAATAGIITGIVFLARTINVAIIGGTARADALKQEAKAAQEQAAAEHVRAQTAATQAEQDLLRREGAMRAAEVERKRIERDLHDGVQPRLVSVGMTLGLAKQEMDKNPEAAKQLVEEAHLSTKEAITELRQLARGIHASVLDDRGLDAALSALAGRSPIPVTLDVKLVTPEGAPLSQVDRDTETATYFVVAEALTNAAKHSGASQVYVRLRMGPNPAGAGSAMMVTVEDNGVGGARIVSAGGLDGVSNRVAAAGGEMRLDSPYGGPTKVLVFIPCAY